MYTLTNLTRPMSPNNSVAYAVGDNCFELFEVFLFFDCLERFVRFKLTDKQVRQMESFQKNDVCTALFRNVLLGENLFLFEGVYSRVKKNSRNNCGYGERIVDLLSVQLI